MAKNGRPPRNKGPTKKPAELVIDLGPPKETKPTGKSTTKKPVETAPVMVKGKKGKGPAVPEPVEPEPPKQPSVRDLIGGPSWTGKLPVNMLSEHCQKQRWDKPDYNQRSTPNGFIYSVTLRQKNSKTGEVTTLPPFKVPEARQAWAAKPSSVEARHFAATYTLFRVCSMKNIHMMMPPVYRDFWKGGFSEMKVEDVQQGRAWMYDADPFQTFRDFQDALVVRQKKSEVRERHKDKDIQHAPAPGQIAPTGSTYTKTKLRPWLSAPKLELGKQMRSDIERLVRKNGEWNPTGIVLPKARQDELVAKISALGFRRTHVSEAAEICKDGDEILEWLLINVPEDDLPPWALPERYMAGLSMVNTDIKREKAIQRLAAGGYSSDLCAEVFDFTGGKELVASAILQHILLAKDASHARLDKLKLSDFEEYGNSDVAREQWMEELEVLGSIFDDRCTVNPVDNSVRIKFEAASERGDLDASLLFLPPNGPYPGVVPLLSVQAKLPAYIRLSITKRALIEAETNSLGDAMIFNIVDWVESNLSNIVANPGKLSEVSAGISAVQTVPIARLQVKDRSKPKVLDWTAGTNTSLQILATTLKRAETESQKAMIKARQKLPAWKYRNKLVDVVNSHQVVIISGETGSGKSTQSVQFILDDLIFRQMGSCANIICTQPRRISALGLAERVSDERCSPIGTEVGYAIRGESKIRPGQTRISFVTTGVLLRRLQGKMGDMVESLADVSHVVIDEVHERSLDTDFLLMLMRRVLKKRPDLKLILMSATLDATLFQEYFEPLGPVGRIDIEGRTFPVTDYYLDDVVEMTKFGGNPDEDAGPLGKTLGTLIREAGMTVNYSLIAQLVAFIDRTLPNKDGSILIFLPGSLEISRTLDALRIMPGIYGLPLHASLLPIEQKRVFHPPPKGMRKVIAATNVAETSITIADVVAVIDTGRVKETRYDADVNMVRLADTWASHAACKQRRGRAGRSQEGICYKMFTRNAEIMHMPERAEPEMRRVPLEQLCLSVRAMGITKVSAFLSEALSPPEAVAIEGAMDLLRSMGALDGEDLTALGRHLATIPADLRCAKMLVYGALFGCLEPCLTIASILTIRSPFIAPPSKREEAKEARSSFSEDSNGDLVTDLRAYEQYVAIREKMLVYSTSTRSAHRELRSWCDSNFLSQTTLNDITSTKAQYVTSLKEIGLVPLEYDQMRGTEQPGGKPPTDTLNGNSRSLPLIRAVVAAALHPQTARIEFPGKKFAAIAGGAVEVNPDSKTIKYFTPERSVDPVLNKDEPLWENFLLGESDDEEEQQRQRSERALKGEVTTTRVFIHPSSTLFSTAVFPVNSAYLAYWVKMKTSKVFMRDLTPVPALALLLFAGNVVLDVHGRGLIVDGWIKVRAWARIGALVGRLRRWLDRVLGRWITGGRAQEGEAEDERKLLALVRKLVEFGGLDA